jgi:hypothetical protein
LEVLAQGGDFAVCGAELGADVWRRGLIYGRRFGEVKATDTVPAEHRVFFAESFDKVLSSTENTIQCLCSVQSRLVWVQEQVMILVVLSNTWEVRDNRDVERLEDI